MPSPSPKRTSSKGRSVDPDELLLNERIAAHKIEYPKQLLLIVGFVTALLPSYLAHAFFHLTWTSLANFPLFIAVMAVTAYLLSQAYAVTFETKFLTIQRHYAETKSAHDEKVLRQLRMKVALAYAIFFINLLFFVFVTLAQGYVFRRWDPRVSLVVSPTIAAVVLGFIAKKNEESRKRRMGRAN